MRAEDRSAWVVRFVDEDLNKKDSALAFSETNLLLDLAERWDAPDITAEVYTGQGNYLLNVLHHPAAARSKYVQGIDYANSHDLKILAAGMLLQIGSSYCQENQLTLAYVYYFRAHDIFVKTGFHCIARIDQYEYSIGRFLFDLEDYKAAMSHFSIAEQYTRSGPQICYNILMALGWCSERLGKQGEAASYLQKRLQLAQREKNAAWIGESSVDVGEQYVQDGCYPEARIYLATGQRLSEQSGQLQTAARALILLSQVNMYEGNLYAAAEKLTQAELYLEKAGARNWYPDLYRGWVSIYEQSGNFREAYQYQQLYEHTSDSIRRAADVIARANIQARLEGRRRIMQLAQVEQTEQTDQMILLVAVCVAIVLGGGGYLFWRYQQRQQKTLIVAKQRAEQTLTRVLRQQASIERQPVEEPKSVLPPAPAVVKQPADHSVPFVPAPDPKTEQTAQGALEQILQLTLLTEDDSRHFRLLVEKVHPGFFAHLRAKFPELTQSETRLLALTKMSLKTKEISGILKVEPNSVRRLRNRIRKKYNLPAGDNFESLLLNDEIQSSDYE